MKKKLFAGAAVMLALAWSGGPALAKTEPGKPAAARAGGAKPSGNEVERALGALAELDEERLGRDRAYAEATLRHIRLARTIPSDAGVEIAFLRIEILAYVTLGRHEEARRVSERLLATGTDEASDYWEVWIAAAEAESRERMAAVIVAALAAVRAEDERAILFEIFNPEAVWDIYRGLTREEKRDQQLAMAEALVAAGWPGESDADSRDSMRMAVVRARTERGDLAGLAPIADGIRSVRSVLELVVLRKYEALGLGADPAARLQAALADSDRTTAAALARQPDDPAVLLERVQYLRRAGRSAEAFGLVEPRLSDPAAMARESEKGMWLVNEAAYALSDLGRASEAADLMGRLTVLDPAAHPYLINLFINHLSVLWEAERAAESLERVKVLEGAQGRYASMFGKMWIWAGGVCALAQLGRGDEAAPWLAKLSENSQENGAAHTRALLCMGDEDAAEALLVRRLGGDDADRLVIGLQDYRGGTLVAPAQALDDRLMRVRERPAVREALEHVGRVMELPLSRTYYGSM
ncbi:MAG: hypothetical protein ACK4K7_05320 [Allosphingosinicella sp.]|uniref:hypothetical protein n=1 Tax=Allosphingosinicella sp. TaxID=2823234 RepID=UPI003950A82B